MKLFFLIILLLNGIQLYFAEDDFSVVSDVIDNTSGDVLAAFGDFNADKLIDIFVINQLGKGVDVLLAAEYNKYERLTLLNDSSSDSITGIMLADFDADVQMDVLVLKSTANVTTAALYWGNTTSISAIPYNFEQSWTDEPVLFDYNADMIPDLLVSLETGGFVVWLSSSKSRNFTQVPGSKLSHLDTLESPHSSAFVDLTNDYAADLFLTTQNGFQVFSKVDLQSDPITYSANATSYFQSSFADFNQDSRLDHILPVQTDSDNPQIRVHTFASIPDSQPWYTIMYKDDFKSSDDVWQFPTSSSDVPGMPALPPTLRTGDYDMDGYPDAITVLQSTKTGSRRAFLLKNIACSGSQCSEFGRKFQVQWDALPNQFNNTQLATFFDLFEDGVLDIVLMTTKASVPSLVFIKNNLGLDTCFLKVTVISGVCSSNCGNHKPYGVNVPGPTVKYISTTASGYPQTSVASQLSQSAHFSLQLPFVIFGLGQTPNFVETVGVGIPMPVDSTTPPRMKTWTQIIPNSQLIVNPNPHDHPDRWKMNLFVTPSRQIYLTGVALLATCGLVAVIVAGLQWNERREDTKEKKQESQKFHFDAM